MERDFMGLSSKTTSSVVKEEASDGCDDSAPLRTMGMHWPFSNNGSSSLGQFLSFKSAQEDQTGKTSCGTSTVTSNAIDTNRKLFSASAQKAFILDNKQAGSHYAMAGYRLPSFDARTPNCPLDMNKYPAPNQTIAFTMNAPIIRSNHSSTGQNVVGSTRNPPSVTGAPVITPISVAPDSSTLDIADARNASKSLGTPAQMTIFYGGTVNVFNDVPPEKAQAIMLLAGDTPRVPLSPMQGKASNVPTILSPVSSTSHAAPQSRKGSPSTNETEAVKPLGISASPITESETPKLVSPVCSTAPSFVPSAVPQARKASLARFLEKRKERVASSTPYNVSINSMACNTPASKGDSTAPMNFMGQQPPSCDDQITTPRL